MLIPLIIVTTDAQYKHSKPEIATIVKKYAMLFHCFPELGKHQYGILMVLPPVGHNFALQPSNWNAIRQRINPNTGLLLRDNFAVSRPHNGQHTETQLLVQLPTLLNNYRNTHGMNPLPAVLLYTRGTPCSGCTQAIVQARRSNFRQGQFIVVYSTNMVNKYMTRQINCENRNVLRGYSGIDVYCVPEPHKNQCMENDAIECIWHND